LILYVNFLKVFMHKFIRHWKFLVIALGLVLASCGGDGDSTSKTDACSAIGLGSKTAATTTAKIINGTPCSDLNKSAVVVVIKNLPDGSSGLCTGTLLTSNQVLTAAHCLEGAASINVYYGATTDKFSILTGSTWTIHPNYARASNGRLTNDVGVINLNRPLNLPAIPVLASSPAKVGQQASIFGYGVSVGGGEVDGQLRSGTMTIAGVDAETIQAVYDSASSDVCSGDSGGPLIVKLGEQQVIAGTTSYGSSAVCTAGEQSVFMNLQSASIQNFLRNVAPGARYL
jgi:secreted trypsin-like serine protease